MGIFRWKKSASAGGDWLLVGLGNPGLQYERSRHNCGYMALDRLAKQLGLSFDRRRFRSLYALGRLDGRRLHLLKPETYMNLSGEAVTEAARFFKIPPEQVLVFYDDIDIDLGLCRLRMEGGPGTHNGMRSIVQQLGSTAFPRLRLGIGPQDRRLDLADFVLGKLQAEELKSLDQALERAVAAALLLLQGRAEEAAQRANVRPGKPRPTKKATEEGSAAVQPGSRDSSARERS